MHALRRSWVLVIAAALPWACGGEPPTENRIEHAATLTAADGSDLLRIVEARPEEMRIGQQTSYTLTIENVGDQPVEGVAVRQHLPERFEVVSVDPAVVGDADDAEARSASAALAEDVHVTEGALVCALGTMPAGRKIAVKVAGVPQEEGELAVRTTIDYRAPMVTKWNVVSPALRLESRLVGDRGEFCFGESIAVTYRISNPGSGTTDPVRIHDPLPDGLVTDSGADEVDLRFDPIGPGGAVERTVRLKAQRAGPFETRARATAGDLTAQSEPLQLRVVLPRMELAVEGPGPVHAKTPASVTVTVHNVGNQPAAGVAVVVRERQNVEQLTAGDGAELDDDRIPLGAMQPGDHRTFTLGWQPSETGRTSLRLDVIADCLPADTAPTHAVVADAVE